MKNLSQSFLKSQSLRGGTLGIAFLHSDFEDRVGEYNFSMRTLTEQDASTIPKNAPLSRVTDNFSIYKG